jgi:hypothetical protein
MGDESTRGSGCIVTACGSGKFAFTANFDIDKYTPQNPQAGYSGTLNYMDECAGVQINSSTLTDYADDANFRAFVFTGPGFEARVFVTDNGQTGDSFEIQIFGSDGDFYSARGTVTAECNSDIVITPGPGPGPGPEPEPEPDNPGTGTPGYWKNHPEAWPDDTITVGGATYTREQAIKLMGKDGAGGDVSYTMFRALVAAMLNVAIGNDSSCVADAIAEADAWLEDNKLGSGVKARSDAWKNGGEALKNTLDSYNNGNLCAPSRG